MRNNAIKFLKSEKIYPIAFLLYTVAVAFFSRDATLIFEWKNIMEGFECHGEYRYFDVPTAYMPPLYPYYLLIFKALFPSSVWV